MTDTSTMGTGSPVVTPTPPRPDDWGPADDWVPADERVAGIDRRTIWPGLVLLAVWALWAHVMPWIDSQVEVDNPIVAGDVINLGFGEVTFVPAVGWQLESGVLLTEGREQAASVPSSARLSSDVVSYTASSGNWDGTADELVDQMIDVNENLDLLLAKDEQSRSAITNADGVPGELVYIAGVNQAALIVAFVFEPVDDGSGGNTAPIGVEIEVVGTPEKLEDLVEEIATMIDSTTYRPAGQEANS